MKKIKILALIFSLAVLFTSCANSTSKTNSQVSETSSGNKSSEKILVVYYSATGSTKEAAQYIAEYSSGDLFEIVPENPYSSDDLNYNDSKSRVSKEHNDKSLRDVPLKATAPDNFNDYDIIFIGYPIWWGEAAWPVNNFVKSNDFSGKTVIPFCTSASSGLSDSGEKLKEMSNSGDWLKGERFSSNPSKSDIEEFVKETIK